MSLELVRLGDYERTPWEPESVGAGSNALGLPPQRVLFLWPFARPTNLRVQVIGHGWAQIGPVHMLLRPGWGLTRQVLGSLDQVHESLSSLSDTPGRHRPPRLKGDDGFFRRYVGFPVQPLTVEGRIWQRVIVELMRRSDLFVADMTAKRRSGGLATELSMLFESNASKRIVLLIDSDRADVELCVSMVGELWAAHGRGRPPRLFLYDSQAPEYVSRAFKAHFKGRATIPIAAQALRELGRS